MRKLQEVISKIGKIDHYLAEQTQDRLDNLTKPQGSLGRLEELAKKMVEITGNEDPPIKNKVIFTLAGDHGIVEEKVSAYPKEVTSQMVYNFIQGGAGINVLAQHVGARVVIVDLGIDAELSRTINHSTAKNFKDKKISRGTRNAARGPAMTRAQAISSIEAGIEVFEEEWPRGIDITGTGDMGIGNTTASSAIAACFTGRPVEELTGKGTGIDQATLANKITVIKKALTLNKPDSGDSLDVLSKVGGFEIGGLAGIILASASRRIPIVIDGFISGAGALIAYHLKPEIKDYLIASHCSVERGHRIILDYMGLNPLLDLNLRLGEGTGAALGINLVEAGIKIMTRMATFKSAGVSKKGLH